METEKTYFNSSLNREDYAVIKDEAYRLGLNIKDHISNIMRNYVESKRMEDTCTTNNNT